MIEAFETAICPWIEVVEGDDTQEILRSFLRIRNALDSLLAGKISWEDYTDIVASEGVDMDDYLGVSQDNLITVGF